MTEISSRHGWYHHEHLFFLYIENNLIGFVNTGICPSEGTISWPILPAYIFLFYKKIDDMNFINIIPMPWYRSYSYNLNYMPEDWYKNAVFYGPVSFGITDISSQITREDSWLELL